MNNYVHMNKGGENLIFFILDIKLNETLSN